MSENYQLKKPASHKSKKRVGRGGGSGLGKTSGRGHKGQLARSGAKRKAWFEGGQMPIQRRIPKRGFNNKFKTTYEIVNIAQLSKIESAEIDAKLLCERGYISSEKCLIKILGKGETSRPVKITADAFSKSAQEKIEKSGGQIIVRS